MEERQPQTPGWYFRLVAGKLVAEEELGVATKDPIVLVF
jgi:hypothetical protein